MNELDQKQKWDRLKLQPVNTHFYFNNKSTLWKQPFNDATFFNYDPENPLYINNWVLQPAVTINGKAYPTFLEIDLKLGCVSDTDFLVDVKNSSTASWRIIYNQYKGLE